MDNFAAADARLNMLLSPGKSNLKGIEERKDRRIIGSFGGTKKLENLEVRTGPEIQLLLGSFLVRRNNWQKFEFLVFSLG